MKIRYADVNGVALRYAITGQGRLRLVLVHEMGGTLESWAEVAGILAPQFEILTYDTRGAGLSEKIRGEVSIDDLSGDLIALLDYVGWEKDILIAGCAIGAATAIRAVTREPTRFKALAALSPALGVAEEKKLDSIAAGERLIKEGVRVSSDKSWDRAFPPALRNNPERANAVRCRKLGNDPESFAALYRMVATMDVEPDLAFIRCPSLFIAGGLDQTRPPDMVRSISAKVSGSRFEVLETGHVMQALTPEIVAQSLLAFFDGNSSRYEEFVV